MTSPSTSATAGSTGLRRRLLVVGFVAFVAALPGIPARATYGAQVSADEPQYLMTALSLGRDFNLDVDDEIENGEFRSFHEIGLNEQTRVLNDSGQRISPHDPLLPLILAAPMRIGGWVGAKMALSLIAGLTAAATLWLAVRRFGVTLRIGSWVVGGFAITPPLTTYGTQVYPALPAALVVVCAVAVLTGTSRPAKSWLAVLAIVTLPWLALKYAFNAAALGVALLWRGCFGSRRLLLAQVGVLAIAGALYLLVHQRVYGGWTVYATGDHFVGGEFEVVGVNPNYVARTNRLIGLIIDRGWGIAAWNPAYLAMPAALVWLGVRRPGASGECGVRSSAGVVSASGRSLPDSWVIFGSIAAAWFMATWVALTMHGWWWSGRQIVPVLPLVVVAVAKLIDDLGGLRIFLASITASALTWWWLAFEASTDRRVLIVDFRETASPFYQAWRRLLPDHIADGTRDGIMTLAWIVLLGVSCWSAWSRRERGISANRAESVDTVC